MYKKCVLAAACCLPLGLLAQKGFTVHGKTGTADAPAMIYLTYSSAGNKVVDSAVLHKGSFQFTGQLSSPAQARLLVKYDTVTVGKKERPDDCYFYIENSDITVNSGDSLKNAVVKGSLTNEEDRVLERLRKPYHKTADSLMAIYRAATAEQRNDSVFKKSMGEVMRTSQAGFDSVSHRFIVDHPNSFIALQAFASLELAYNFNPDTATARFSHFSPELQNSAAGKKITAMIETGRKTSTGVMAMDFTQPDTTGKPVKLSDYRGRYVLVDFWASWCKPCRAENPNVLAAYNRFKQKNFTVLGVSLDEGKRAWLHAVEQDGLPWTQVSDLKGFESPAAVLYGVKAIPSNFLIDPAGKIIGKNLRGEDLEKKLNTLFTM